MRKPLTDLLLAEAKHLSPAALAILPDVVDRKRPTGDLCVATMGDCNRCPLDLAHRLLNHPCGVWHKWPTMHAALQAIVDDLDL